MNVSIIDVPRAEAKAKYKEYLNVIKTRQEKYLHQLKRAYFYASKGKKILDMYEVFKQGGLNGKLQPRFAIARLDWKEVYFQKLDDGAGSFQGSRRAYYQKNVALSLPKNTFGNWKGDEWNVLDLKTAVPMVPANLMPFGNLKEYYVLWECQDWEMVPADPFLLRRISKNVFAVLAEWDLTPLEQSIIRGR